MLLISRLPQILNVLAASEPRTVLLSCQAVVLLLGMFHVMPGDNVDKTFGHLTPVLAPLAVLCREPQWATCRSILNTCLLLLVTVLLLHHLMCVLPPQEVCTTCTELQDLYVLSCQHYVY